MTPQGQGDDGEADPRLRAALESGDPAAVAAALASARVFVGIESRLVELADPAEPPADRLRATAAGPAARPRPRGEKTSEMMLATLRLPSGATALPVFSGVAALAAWRASARPVPVPAADACAEAARLGHETVVVDVAGPVTAALDVSALTGSGGASLVEDAGAPAAPAAADPEAAGRAAGGRQDELRPVARPWDGERRLRVAAELDALAAEGLGRGARLWQAELATAAGGAAAEVVAFAVRGEGLGDEARLDEIARRLRSAVAGATGAGPAIVFVGPADAAALRRRLGRGLAARRWRRRSAPA
jgi:hypothetical protein